MIKKLDWKAHTEALCKRLSSAAYALHKLTRVVQQDAVLTSYHGLAASLLRYGLVFWGNSTNFLSVFKAQKRCIRSIFGLQTTDSCKPKLIEHKILTLPSLYILEVASFVKSNPQLFPRLSEAVQRNRRDKGRLQLQPAKKKLLLKSIICMGPIIFNKIPKILREMQTHAFKNILKKILMDKCYYTINEFIEDKQFCTINVTL